MAGRRKGDPGCPKPELEALTSSQIQWEQGSYQIGLPAASSEILTFLQTCSPASCAVSFWSVFRKCCAFSRLRNTFGDFPGFNLSYDNLWHFVLWAGSSGGRVRREGWFSPPGGFFFFFAYLSQKWDLIGRELGLVDLPADGCVDDNPYTYYDQYYYFHTLFQNGCYMPGNMLGVFIPQLLNNKSAEKIVLLIDRWAKHGSQGFSSLPGERAFTPAL